MDGRSIFSSLLSSKRRMAYVYHNKTRCNNDLNGVHVGYDKLSNGVFYGLKDSNQHFRWDVAGVEVARVDGNGNLHAKGINVDGVNLGNAQSNWNYGSNTATWSSNNGSNLLSLTNANNAYAASNAQSNWVFASNNAFWGSNNGSNLLSLTTASNAYAASNGQSNWVFASNTSVAASNTAFWGSNNGSNLLSITIASNAYAASNGQSNWVFASNTASWSSNNGSNLLLLTVASNAYAASNGQSNWVFASNTSVAASNTAFWGSNNGSNLLSITIASNAYAASNGQSNWVFASNTVFWASNTLSNYAPSNVFSNLIFGGAAFSNLQVIGNARIQGDLIVNGSTTVINTNQSTTEQLIVTNDGTGPALIVNQIGLQPIIDIQDDGVSALFVANGGLVGINNSNPQYRVDINGTIAASIVREGGAELGGKYAASNAQSNWVFASNTSVAASNTAYWSSNNGSNLLSLAAASNAYAASNSQSNWVFASNTALWGSNNGSNLLSLAAASTAYAASNGQSNWNWTSNQVSIVNAKSYGALGDGSTDDSAAIQAALNSSFGTVFLPPGTYICGARIDIPVNKALQGYAKSNTILKRKAAANIDAIVRLSSGGSIRSLTVDGNHPNIGSASNHCYGILSYSNNDIGLRDLVVRDTYGIGVGLNYIKGAIINSVNVLTTANYQPGFWVSNSKSVTMADCLAASNALDGLLFTNVTSLRVGGCKFNSNGLSLPLGSGALGAGGIYCASSATDVIISDTEASYNTEDGINVLANNITVSRCYLHDNNLSGVILRTSSNVNVCDSTILNNGNSTNVSNPGVWGKSGICLDGVSQANIVGNIIEDNRVDKTQKYGVEELTNATSSNVVCIGNLMSNNKLGEASGANVVVFSKNNILTKPEASGLYALSNGQSNWNWASNLISNRLPLSGGALTGALYMGNNALYLRTANDSNHGLQYFSSVDGVRLFGFAGGVLGTTSNNTNTLYWKPNGYVGVGYANPTERLNVNGNILMPSSTFLRIGDLRFVDEYNSSGSDRWWKIAAMSNINGAGITFNDIDCSRVDGDCFYPFVRFRTKSTNGFSNTFQFSRIGGSQGQINVYTNTSNLYEVWVKALSFSVFRGAVGLSVTTFENLVPTTSAAWITVAPEVADSNLIFNYSTASNAPVQYTSVLNRVGFGTSNPAYNLEVIGEINATSNIRQGGALVSTLYAASNAQSNWVFASNTSYWGSNNASNLLSLATASNAFAASNAQSNWVFASNTSYWGSNNASNLLSLATASNAFAASNAQSNWVFASNTSVAASNTAYWGSNNTSNLLSLATANNAFAASNAQSNWVFASNTSVAASNTAYWGSNDTSNLLSLATASNAYAASNAQSNWVFASNTSVAASNTAYWGSNNTSNLLSLATASNAYAASNAQSNWVFASNTSVAASNNAFWGSNNGSNLLSLTIASNAYAASNGQSNWEFASNTAFWGSNNGSNLLSLTTASNAYAASNGQSNWVFASNTSVAASNTSYWGSNNASNLLSLATASNAYAASNTQSNWVFASNTSVAASNTAYWGSNNASNLLTRATASNAYAASNAQSNWVFASNTSLWTSNNKLSLSGGTMTGSLTFPSNSIVRVGDIRVVDEYNSSGSDRWWKAGTFSNSQNGTNFTLMGADMSRVDQDCYYPFIRFRAKSTNNYQPSFQYSRIGGAQGHVNVYTNSSNSTYELWIKLTSFTTFKAILSEGAFIFEDFQPTRNNTWTTIVPEVGNTSLTFNYGTASNNPIQYTSILDNVGFGTTSPAHKLDVNGSINASSNIYASNVGIGTTVPISALHVNGRASIGDSLVAQSNNAVRSLNIISTDAVSRLFRTATGDPAYELWTSNLYKWDTFVATGDGSFNIRDRTTVDARRLVITSNGNVGIGTSSPSYLLDVAGDVNATNIRQGTSLISTLYAASNAQSNWVFASNNASNYLPLSGGTVSNLNVAGPLRVVGSTYTNIYLSNSLNSNQHTFQLNSAANITFFYGNNTDAQYGILEAASGYTRTIFTRYGTLTTGDITLTSNTSNTGTLACVSVSENGQYLISKYALSNNASNWNYASNTSSWASNTVGASTSTGTSWSSNTASWNSNTLSNYISLTVASNSYAASNAQSNWVFASNTSVWGSNNASNLLSLAAASTSYAESNAQSNWVFASNTSVWGSNNASNLLSLAAASTNYAESNAQSNWIFASNTSVAASNTAFWGSNNGSNLLSLTDASNAYAASNAQSNWVFASNTSVWSSNNGSNILSMTEASNSYAASNAQSNWVFASNTSVWGSNNASNLLLLSTASNSYAPSNAQSNWVLPATPPWQRAT